MKSQLLISISIGLLLIEYGVFSQDSLDVDNKEQEVTEKTGKVLVAKRESEFKDAVAEKIKLLTEQKNINTEIVDIKILKKKNTEHYDAVVIFNEFRAWHLNIHTRRFFRKIKPSERKKVIMISTAIMTDLKTNEENLDAVTIASQMNNVDSLAENIMKKILSLLTKE